MLSLVTLFGCADRESSERPTTRARVRVFASNQPLESMVRVMANDGVELVMLPSRGTSDPAEWTPTSDDIRSLQECDLVVLNGAGYEPWSEQAALSRTRTLDTTARVRAQLITEPNTTHSHGPQGAHAHGSTAFTTWLSPKLASQQASAIAQRLTQLLPARATEIHREEAKFADAMTAIEETLRQVARARPRWLASHPVYQYLAQDSGLTIDSVHWEPNEMASEEEWTRLRSLLTAAHGAAPLMLWEGEPTQAVRERLAQLGVTPVVFPPRGRLLGDAEFAAEFRRAVDLMLDACDEDSATR